MKQSEGHFLYSNTCTNEDNNDDQSEFTVQNRRKLTRAQQWRQSCGFIQDATRSHVLPNHRWAHQTHDYSTHLADGRISRTLPDEPCDENSYRSAIVNVLTTQIHLTPPTTTVTSCGPRQIGRASSFDGRQRYDIVTGTVFPHRNIRPSSEYLARYWSPQTSQFHQNSTRNSLRTNATNPLNRQSKLVVAPSIEVSRVHEHSDSCSSSEDISNSGRTLCKEVRVNSALSLPTRESPIHRSSDSPLQSKHTLRQREFSTYYSRQCVSSDLPNPVNSAYLGDKPRNRRAERRPKLTRQRTSIQVENPTLSPRRTEQGSSKVQMDEFDYFCQIAKSPSGTKDSTHTSPSSLTPSRQASAMRSHSMRSTSPDENIRSNEVTRPRDNLSTPSKPSRPNDSASKPTHLKPPSRGQLRRASTDDGGTHSTNERSAVSATLSYASIHTGLQNLCKTPPSSVPKLPPCQVPCVNPSVPLGVPLSPDSLLADEPGMTYYQVQLLGAAGVGKTALCQQLARLTAGGGIEFDPDNEESNNESHSVTAALEGSVYTINFVDTSADSFEQNLEVQVHECIDAFIVLYAIDDSASFDAAKLIIQALVTAFGTPPTPGYSSKSGQTKQNTVPILIFLVANKTDLVRGRQVSNEDGRLLANLHGAKFIEVSASLNHMVAELFIQLINHLKEIEQKGRDPRLPVERRTTTTQPGVSGAPTRMQHVPSTRTFRIPTSAKSSFSKFFKRHFTKTSMESE